MSSPDPELSHLYSGKVRDIYALGDDRLLLVTSDRLSAFDVVMTEPITDKGRVLTAMSAFWFEHLADVVGNHLLSTSLDALPVGARRPEWAGRVMVCRRAEMLPVECIVRGYLTGSAWKEYVASGTMHGETLPPGLLEAAQLPEPTFTPSTKADEGHDMNISFGAACDLVGTAVMEEARRVSIELYSRGAAWAAARGHPDRRHQVRARNDRRPAGSGRRGPHAGLVAVLAGRGLASRIDASVVRQATRAGLPRRTRLGQAASAPSPAPRGRAGHVRAVRQGLRDDHGSAPVRLARLSRVGSCR